ncbi:MAG TPA: IPT/TIG domain-containing protein [Candidatus Paceibacterota bacterium]|nr:IPT/TIG domain-containing protein [Candidatus Paceibacterota bacterium]
MNKFIVSLVAIATLMSVGVASAQTVCGGSYTRDLTVGSRGSDVSSLQSFLVAQNYPGGGSWMITGYYGQATAAAVRNYQSTHGLVQSGMFDAATRASVSGCAGNYSGNYNYVYNNPTYPYTGSYNYNNNYNYNYNGGYPYNYGYNPYSGSLRIDSLNVTSAVTGAAVTITGSGFDYNNNTVYVGNIPVTNIASWNGTSLTFTVPQNVSGSVLVYVANSRGSSNSLSLNVQNYGNTCGYPYNYNTGSCGCSYGISCNQQLTITQIAPDNGAVGSTVTIYGTGFTTSGNTVHFGNGVIINLNSIDGRSLSFTVPTYLTGYNSQTVGLGTYPVYVINGAGYSSNTMNYTVTSLGSTGTPTIGSVNGPNTLNVGVTGTWTIQVTTPGSSYSTVSVAWGDTGNGYVNQAAPQQVYGGNQTLTFTHAYYAAGTYTVTFTLSNQYGQTTQATATVQVNGSGSGSGVTLTSMTPTSGRVGTQVVLTGSNFTSDNTVHFGNGGTMHVPSYNGNTIYFTIPSYISPCDVVTPGNVCATYAQQVTPGVYQIYVQNSYGQSVQQSFTVTY